MEKYEERCKDLDLLFQGIFESSYKLHIIDRNYPKNKKYAYPKPYDNFTIPALPHNELQKVHKTADWAININTVKTSETMFANRAFELLANGVNLLSNYSVGINNILPSISIVHNKEDINYILNSLSDEEIYEKQLFGIRTVMRSHTCFDRLYQFLHPVKNINNSVESKILVLTQKINQQVSKCFSRQTYANKALKEINNVSEDEANKYDIIAFFSNNSEYEEFYLEDMSNCFKYTDSNYITKDTWIDDDRSYFGIEHNYINRVSSKYRTLFWKDKFNLKFLINIKDGDNLENGYACDRFNYREKLFNKKVNKTTYKISIIIPIYNNGEHLYGKCFSSLRRSSIFNEIELIFIDDGSTDTNTLAIEKWLERRYNNIRLFCFSDGGSGSASRPRNKGLQMASSQYITFLDPDNEAIFDGYAILYDKIKNSNYDFVLGNMIKSDTKDKVADYFKSIVSCYGSNEIINTGRNLSLFNFISPSIQAMLINKDFLLKNKLEEVVGAIGQDTLYAWQIIHYSKQFSVINIPIHVYYAQTSNSVTNSVDIKFFAKLFKCQKAKYKWLLESKYINDFMDLKFNYYFFNIVLGKISHVKKEFEKDCIIKCYEIFKIFANFYNKNNKHINNFVNYCKNQDYKQAYNTIYNLINKQQKSLIPSLKSVIEKEKKIIECDISITKIKNLILIFIKNNSTKVKYSLTVSNALRNFNTIYESKYINAGIFEYDFKNLKPGLYCININEKSDIFRRSNEIALVKNDLNGNTFIMNPTPPERRRYLPSRLEAA